MLRESNPSHGEACDLVVIVEVLYARLKVCSHASHSLLSRTLFKICHWSQLTLHSLCWYALCTFSCAYSVYKLYYVLMLSTMNCHQSSNIQAQALSPLRYKTLKYSTHK